MDNAFKYIEENKGIDTEQSYPYHAKVTNSLIFSLLCCVSFHSFGEPCGGGGGKKKKLKKNL